MCIAGNKMVIVVATAKKQMQSGCIHGCIEFLNSSYFLRVGCQTFARDNVTQKVK